MQKKLTGYKHVLVDKILHAKSYIDVISIVDTKLKKVIKESNLNDLPQRFITETIDELTISSETTMDADQWSYIRIAKVHLQAIQKSLTTKAGN